MSDESLDVDSVTVQFGGINATRLDNSNGDDWSSAVLVEASKFEDGVVNISVTYADRAGNVGVELTESGIAESVTIGMYCALCIYVSLCVFVW